MHERRSVPRSKLFPHTRGAKWGAILAGIALLTLAGLIAGAIYAYLSYRQAAAQLIVQRDRQVALLTAVRLQNELNKLSDDLTALARTSSLYLGLPDRQRQALKGAGPRLGLFDGGVVLQDNNGRVRATQPERWDIMGKDWSDKEFFRAMLGRARPAVHFSPVMEIGPEGAPVVVVTVPVLGENEELVGTLSGLFKLGESRVSAFYASVVRLRLPGTGNTFIADANGRILYDSGYERTGQTLEIPPNADSTPDTIRTTRDAEGHEVVAAYAPVPGTSWMLITETDWADAMAPVERFATGLIVLLGLGMIVPTLGVALLVRNQRSPAAEVEDGARVNMLIRQRLLPRQAPLIGGWDVAVHHAPASRASASAHDLYDFMILPDGRLMLALVTVADTGASAVHLMTTIRAALRTAACQAPSAGQALSVCNNLLCPELGQASAVASLFAVLDPSSARVQIANAGLSSPMHWNGSELVEMREGTALLGQTLDVEYDYDDVLLNHGESFVFYSSGALGARPEIGEPFGPERVRMVLNAAGARSAQSIIDALRLDLNEFADRKSLNSLDITLIALSRPAEKEKAAPPRRSLRDELRALGETDTDL
jgi:serine phosphatase RsbU (regulator of sigma subunit)